MNVYYFPQYMCANVFTEYTIVHVYIIVYTEMELFNLREIIIRGRKNHFD